MRHRSLFFLFAQLLLLFAYNANASQPPISSSVKIKTSVIRYVGLDTAFAGGVIVNPSSEAIIRAGICYSKNPQPTVSDFVVERIGVLDSFSLELRNLNIQQAYYVKAFVETSAGIIYGPQRTFATDPAMIGARTNGGILFYVLKPGDQGYVQGEVHGLVAADKFSTSTYTWRNGIDSTTNATDSVIGTGALNTQKIVAIQGTGNYAAKFCDDLVHNGFSDWYLPSAHELVELRNSRISIGGVSTHWSSTESTKSTAAQTSTNGKIRIVAKSQGARVVAIRKF